MDYITENIVIGDFPDAENAEELLANGITAVLNLCLNREVFPRHRALEDNNIEYAKVGLVDGSGNTLHAIVAAVDVLRQLLLRNDKVLVNCAAGVNRAPAIVALYLSEYENMTYRNAKLLVKEKRHLEIVDDIGKFV